jgi:quercetin dioxygenase-like cupin family protein
MKEKYNQLSPQPSKEHGSIDASLVTVDIPALIKRTEDESSWKDSKRIAITIFKTNGLRILLIGLKEGAEMARHTADGNISVQVLDGKIQFNTDQQSVDLYKGEMLMLRERISHSILAKEKSIFLLTVAVQRTDKL